MLCQACFWIFFFVLNNVHWKKKKAIKLKRDMGNFSRLHHRCRRCHRLSETAESDDRKCGNSFMLLLCSSLFPNALTFCSRAQLANVINDICIPLVMIYYFGK